jgi:hypothetical protein
MIHHSCDLCKRTIDTEQDVRYVVKMEVYAALDPALDETDNDRDGLQEVQDLCPECRKKFLKQPLGRAPVKQFDFSQN